MTCNNFSVQMVRNKHSSHFDLAGTGASLQCLELFSYISNGNILLWRRKLAYLDASFNEEKLQE